MLEQADLLPRHLVPFLLLAFISVLAWLLVAAIVLVDSNSFYLLVYFSSHFHHIKAHPPLASLPKKMREDP